MGCLRRLVYSIMGTLLFCSANQSWFSSTLSVIPRERLAHRHWFGLFYGKSHPRTGFHCYPGVLFDGTSAGDFE